jgi:hypothetical protein
MSYLYAMKLPPLLGFVDLGVITVVVVFAVLPPREMIAAPVVKGDETVQFAVALAEARAIARPDDGLAVSDLGRKLGDAKLKDWAIELTVHAAKHMSGTPTAWRGQLAASVAYIDRLDVRPGLEQANAALESCHASPDTCPSWEEIRLSLYQDHLDAGVKSGIDPHRDPVGFRRAGEAALREIHLGRRRDGELPQPSGSGSGTPPPPTPPAPSP